MYIDSNGLGGDEDIVPSIVDLTAVPVFTFLRQKFLPAESFADATLTLSTFQILKEVMQHTGNDNITPGAVYKWMKDCGYRYEIVGPGLSFVWLLKTPEDVGF